MLRILVGLTASALVFAQMPGQYPTGQPRPGQYPQGGQNPQGQYPQGQYPQGQGGGLPIPSIKFPKRAPKGEKAEKGPKLTAIEGTLRQLGEKELVLESKAKGVQKFRLLAKTLFRDKAGEPMRDSLLKPGDLLQIEVSAEDEETAVRVNLVRPGTAEERAGVEAKTGESAPEAPSAAPRSSGAEPVVAPEKAAARAEVSTPKYGGEALEDRPILRRGVPDRAKKAPVKREVETTPEPPEEPALLKLPVAAAADPVIAAAREEATNFTASLPNFLVLQHTLRYMSATNPPDWNALDTVSADVVCVNGQEEYRNIKINGRPTKAAAEKTGAWSTGEFVTTQQDILSPMTAAQFSKRGTDRIGGRTVLVYNFSVKQPFSHWQVHSTDEGKMYRPGYKGTMWIDQETNRVMRIEQQSLSFPGDFPFDKAEIILEYDFVRIDNRMFLLPVHSENMICQRGSNNCSRNEINFRNYRKFGADSKIDFEKN